MKKSSYTLLFLIAFLFSILFYHYFPFPTLIVAGFVFLIVLLAPGKILLSKWKILMIILLAVCLAIVRLHFAQHIPVESDIDFYNDRDEKVTIIGYIADEPDVRNDQVKYTLWVEKIAVDENETDVRGYVLVSGSRYPVYPYGSVLEVTGKLQTPGQIDKFSYQNYLKRYGIYAVIYRGKIERLEGNKGNTLYKGLFVLKGRFEGILNQIYAEPHGSFMAGLLLGSRKGIPEHLMEKFNTTGLTHIIAISGANITIIIAIVTSFFAFLPRKLAYKVAILFILLFTILVGASAAVVRAAIMGILGVIALHHGRKTNVTLAILFTASLMILWNPYILFYDVGFQLSFLAVAGLIYIAPHIEKYFLWLPETMAIREAVVLTLAAQISAVPIIVYSFGRLSLVAPLSNLLVGPIISFAMLFGFAAVMIGYFVFPLGLVLGYLGYLILEYMIWVVEVTSKMPYASVDIPEVSIWVVGMYYGVLIAMLLFYHYTKVISLSLKKDIKNSNCDISNNF